MNPSALSPLIGTEVSILTAGTNQFIGYVRGRLVAIQTSATSAGASNGEWTAVLDAEPDNRRDPRYRYLIPLNAITQVRSIQP
jgi:hypothetical protein